MSSPPRLAVSQLRSAATRRSVLASALALTVTFPAVVSVAPTYAAKVQAAKVTLTRVAVAGTTLVVSGRVSLPINTANERKHTHVYLTLTGGTSRAAKTETFTAKLTSRNTFTAKLTTTLTGALGLAVVAKVGGKRSGKKIVRTISVTAPASRATGASPSAGSGSSSTSGPSSTSGSSSTPGIRLNGTFDIEPGIEHPSGLLSGSYFRMQDCLNPDSPLLNLEYTPLLPGTDGGLETFAYQEPPVPAFAGGNIGGALANKITQPQAFLGWYFGIATAPTDLQEGLPDPLPQIVDTDGKLSGQITDWNAQWNGQSFNQGAPKANGTLSVDGRGSTTLPTGSYDAATGHYLLTWTSVIVGGPFNGFIGEWHLEGTFVPEA